MLNLRFAPAYDTRVGRLKVFDRGLGNLSFRRPDALVDSCGLSRLAAGAPVSDARIRRRSCIDRCVVPKASRTSSARGLADSGFERARDLRTGRVVDASSLPLRSSWTVAP